MPTKNYAYIAKEGHPALGIVGLCALVLQFSLGTFAALPAWLTLIGLLVMFRDPTQVPPSTPLAIVSPIHGRVLDVRSCTDPWLQRSAERIHIRTGFFDIRSLYAPIESKIVEQWSSPPDPDPNHECPPHSSAFHLRSDEGDDVILVITRSTWGGRLSFKYNPGERIGHGRRVGYANFGCSARIYLPQGSQLEVGRGDKVSAGSSIIANLIHLTRLAKAPHERSDLSDPNDQA